MPIAARKLREDVLAIWQAGVDAVRAERLVRNVVRQQDDRLVVCGRRFGIRDLGRIAVVGTGKAGAGMAAAIEGILGEDLVHEKVVGWVNVPEDCVRPLQKIHLHGARPAGVNEPTSAGVQGSREILRIVGKLSDRDLCLVLLSGGGSALLPAPKPPVTLDDKRAVTRCLMLSGATIQELNAVRKRLSQIKGGGLARASNAGRTIALIISDIVGDPLDMIASGPTYPDPTSDADALAVLRKFAATDKQANEHIPRSVIEFLEWASSNPEHEKTFPTQVENHIIGNNEVAVKAATQEAVLRGYQVDSLGSNNAGEANQEGRELAQRCLLLRSRAEQDEITARPICILSGGEPVVHLAKPDRPGKGGRNQQLVLAGLDAMKHDRMDRIVLLSGGTDGEDGPTDAAGAWADAELRQSARSRGLDPRPYLERNDAYSFFDQLNGLIKTGPTHTNVMDLRVALVGGLGAK